MKHEFRRSEANGPQYRWYGAKPAWLMLLSYGELTRVTSQHDIALDAGTEQELIEELAEFMPDSSFERLEVPALPLHKDIPTDALNHRTFSMGTKNSIAQKERKAAKRIVERYFDIEGYDNDWNGPEKDFYTRIQIMRVQDLQSADRAAQLLDENSHLLPQTVTLEEITLITPDKKD
jgi:hypothetical protein